MCYRNETIGETLNAGIFGLRPIQVKKKMHICQVLSMPPHNFHERESIFAYSIAKATSAPRFGCRVWLKEDLEMFNKQQDHVNDLSVDNKSKLMLKLGGSTDVTRSCYKIEFQVSLYPEE